MINILILIFCALIFIYLSLFLYKKFLVNNKKSSSQYMLRILEKYSAYLIVILISFVFIDMFVYKILGHGYPTSYNQEDIQRAPSPYDMFAGKQNYVDHNSDGFRGNEFKEKYPEKISIAFFGGSTGYNGDPPIIDIIKQNLEASHIETETFNFSSVSSNHNQHLHRLLKFSNYKYDFVLFYGGFNETLQTMFYDPRPGYPYNFWIRDELSPMRFLLLKYFSIPSEIDKKTGLISNISKIRKNENYGSNEWIDRVINNYVGTLLTSKNLTEKFINPNKCKKTSFFAIYQPISKTRINDKLSFKLIDETIKKIRDFEFIYDFSNLYQEKFFSDLTHVNQKAKEIMARSITDLINKKYKDFCLN